MQDGEDNVVNVAEAGRFGFFGVVQATGPVDGDVGLVVCEFAGGVKGGAGVERAVVVKAVEDGAVITHVVLKAFVVGFRRQHISWCYSNIILV